MELVRQRHEIESDLDANVILWQLEKAGRTCYKSEWRNSEDNFEKTTKFVKGILDRGHESVIEHESVTVRFITNRGVTHELVRHRLASYSQESTRFCDYGNDEIKFIIPVWSDHLEPSIVRPYIDSQTDVLIYMNADATQELNVDNAEYMWLDAMSNAEDSYKKLSRQGLSLQHARGVLPIDLKTEIVVTANLREWRHIFDLRCSERAHPQIKSLMLGLLSDFYSAIPVIFNDLALKYQVESKIIR